MTCDFCHAQVPDGAQYCAQCGTLQTPAAAGPWSAPANDQWADAQPAAGPTSNLAVASLVSGLIAWFVFPVIAAIVAVVTGHMARKEIRESSGRIGGDGMALTGLVLGYVQIALVAVVLVVILGVVGFAVVAHR